MEFDTVGDLRKERLMNRSWLNVATVMAVIGSVLLLALIASSERAGEEMGMLEWGALLLALLLVVLVFLAMAAAWQSMSDQPVTSRTLEEIERQAAERGWYVADDEEVVGKDQEPV